MKRINILNEDTANKIAAGEVVERPSSVVKELVENSIDANSKNILIEIEEGGTSLIRIVDDGDGIYKDDISKAFLPHATSKIKESEDIYNINTLGFRGEALPSIASVAKVNLKSKQEDEKYGYEIEIEGGKFSEVTECGINKGTIIEVHDLFFNVPARKKFLKSVSKEGSLITDIITRIALANPSISFKLYNNHKKVLHTFGNGDLKDTIRTVYGKNITDNIIYYEDTSDLVTIYGYVGKEDIARGSRNNQSIFVNKRYIKNRSLAVAVEQAFKSFSTVNKFPFFVLFIEIYPEYVDVNIHPTKAEVKFNDERMIFKKIFGAVHTSLKNEVFDTFAIKEEEQNIKQSNIPTFEEITFKIKEEEEKVKLANNAVKEVIESGKVLTINNDIVSNNVKTLPIDDTSLNVHKNDSINLDNLTVTEVSIPLDLKSNSINEDLVNEYSNHNHLNIDNKNSETMTKEIYKNSDSNKCSSDKKSSFDEAITNSVNFLQDEVFKKNHYIELNNKDEFTSVNNGIDEEIAFDNQNEKHTIKRTAKFPPMTIIGQYNKTYILGEYDGTLYMIDQHAAHEKIYFEKYLNDIENGDIVIQPLMVPSIIDLTIDDYSYFEENKEVFKQAGFVLEEFGGTSLALKEVPYFLGKLNPKKLFLEILDNLKNLGNGKTTEVKHNAIATKACKAAIKGNDKLELNEMVKLVEELRYIDDPFHCPHGRPVIIKFTSVDIDKKFKRII
ncbi:DNA mismatch repair protein MutL [Clostridium saccharobutylicum]|uniref:DNA mismatch repair endonuclease MutL n=1 Tax=Clostridium saccharobutylicum TaxID=169679 RepID=UPI000983E453|nr:DNA mismatch repair endonuclease MutL [Clostridium saccharobutylicum]AQS10081.1 DNA mismatch repair protein MutL [Clostridium saccharobutylicum]MBC2437277.1 DNA mismatch repair endonuclease MutL [Clostridium saccharobutylicum]NSB89134.1 DNA mismatch repair protein MutL [Clostridium saccharobutylicum]NYC30990.1 DNA mismatch repair protein MutL [Clostridium saccharobutylicum]OOM17620.1 DNA mismatch repair protein MutL [Clostridium saccharobutylicum]